MTVRVTDDGPVRVVTLDRPEVRNAVDGEHARALYDAFAAFDAEDTASVAVLHGAGGVFCAGADLAAVSRAETRGSTTTTDRAAPSSGAASADRLSP